MRLIQGSSLPPSSAEGAAVIANPFHGFDDDRVFGKPLFQGRQGALLHLSGQRRRLAGFERKRHGGDQAGSEHPRCDAFAFK